MPPATPLRPASTRAIATVSAPPQRRLLRRILTVLLLVFSGGFSALALLAAVAALIDHRWTEVFEPAQQAISGFIAVGVLLWSWRRHGFLRVAERTSYEAYAVKRRVEDWNAARESLARTTAHAQQATSELDPAAAERAHRDIDDARQREHTTRERARAAVLALHKKFPDDPTLAEDLKAAFPDTPTVK